MPVARIVKAATMFRRLLISSLVCENLVPMPMRPQMRERPTIYKGVIAPNKGKNCSPAISPAIKALTPNATDKIINCRGLSMRKRFFPVLIFSVSSTILKAIMKQKTNTMTLAKPANLYIKVPPSSAPSQYIRPCPAANANTNSILRHHPFFFSTLKAVEATQMQKVNAMTNVTLTSFVNVCSLRSQCAASRNVWALPIARSAHIRRKAHILTHCP